MFRSTMREFLFFFVKLFFIAPTILFKFFRFFYHFVRQCKVLPVHSFGASCILCIQQLFSLAPSFSFICANKTKRLKIFPSFSEFSIQRTDCARLKLEDSRCVLHETLQRIHENPSSLACPWNSTDYPGFSRLCSQFPFLLCFLFFFIFSIGILKQMLVEKATLYKFIFQTFSFFNIVS